MLLRIHPQNPQPRLIKQVAEVLAKGEVAVIPTDTVYAFAALASNARAVEQLCKLKGVKPEKMNFSCAFLDLAQVATFTSAIPNPVFKVMKRALPGPYTFILNAGGNALKMMKNRKTIGVRIPDNPFVISLLEQIQGPLLVSSVHHPDPVIDYFSDAEEIEEEWGKRIAVVVDGGAGGNNPSTVIDCTTGVPVVTREGAGSTDVTA